MLNGFSFLSLNEFVGGDKKDASLSDAGLETIFKLKLSSKL